MGWPRADHPRTCITECTVTPGSFEGDSNMHLNANAVIGSRLIARFQASHDSTEYGETPESEGGPILRLLQHASESASTPGGRRCMDWLEDQCHPSPPQCDETHTSRTIREQGASASPAAERTAKEDQLEGTPSMSMNEKAIYSQSAVACETLRAGEQVTRLRLYDGASMTRLGGVRDEGTSR